MEACCLAGKSGARTSPLPDFYIGAHAAIGRLALLTRDAGRYRTYSPKIEILAPTKLKPEISGFCVIIGDYVAVERTGSIGTRRIERRQDAGIGNVHYDVGETRWERNTRIRIDVP